MLKWIRKQKRNKNTEQIRGIINMDDEECEDEEIFVQIEKIILLFN